MVDLKKPKLSIGMPIYNAEKFLHSRLTSLLSQVFSDYEIIISDDASMDNTQKICEEFERTDQRIKYFRQEKNLGFNWNFDFVLKKASGKYFFWASQDDIILPGFIEKNISVLESDNNIISSTSQVKPYGEKTDYLSKNNVENFTEKLKKVIIQKFTPLQNYSTSGSYEKKIRYYLKLRGHQQVFYGIFRTEQIQKFFVPDFPTCMDLATMLNALKFGDFNVLDEVLTYRYDGGISSKGLFNYARAAKLNFIQVIFLYYPFIKWCWKNLGVKIFFKNIDCLIKFNLELVLFFLVDIIRKLNTWKFLNIKK